MSNDVVPVALHDLKEFATDALWTGKWYDQGCNTVACDYDGKEGMDHDEIAHPCPLGLTEYLVAVQPKNTLVLLATVAALQASIAEFVATEEGAKEAFGHIVEQKEELKQRCKLLEQTIKEQQNIIFTQRAAIEAGKDRQSKQGRTK